MSEKRQIAVTIMVDGEKCGEDCYIDYETTDYRCIIYGAMLTRDNRCSACLKAEEEIAELLELKRRLELYENRG